MPRHTEKEKSGLMPSSCAAKRYASQTVVGEEGKCSSHPSDHTYSEPESCTKKKDSRYLIQTSPIRHSLRVAHLQPTRQHHTRTQQAGASIQQVSSALLLLKSYSPPASSRTHNSWQAAALHTQPCLYRPPNMTSPYCTHHPPNHCVI